MKYQNETNKMLLVKRGAAEKFGTKPVPVVSSKAREKRIVNCFWFLSRPLCAMFINTTTNLQHQPFDKNPHQSVDVRKASDPQSFGPADFKISPKYKRTVAVVPYTSAHSFSHPNFLVFLESLRMKRNAQLDLLSYYPPCDGSI